MVVGISFDNIQNPIEELLGHGSSTLINHSAFTGTPNETFLGRPSGIYASCVEVGWRLKRNIVL
jgi:hypothetical protein